MQFTSSHLQGMTCPSTSENASLSRSPCKSRRVRRRASKGNKRKRGHLLHVRAASTAQPLPQNFGPLPPPAEPGLSGQQSVWNSLLSKLSSSWQRQRAEDHLPLCKAFGVASLEELRVTSPTLLPWPHMHCHHVCKRQNSLLDTRKASCVMIVGTLAQDVFNCMCLSEGVYKVVDYGVERAAEILTAIIEGFPPGLVTIKRVEWSLPDAEHRSEANLGQLSSVQTSTMTHVPRGCHISSAALSAW